MSCTKIMYTQSLKRVRSPSEHKGAGTSHFPDLKTETRMRRIQHNEVTRKFETEIEKVLCNTIIISGVALFLNWHWPASC